MLDAIERTAKVTRDRILAIRENLRPLSFVDVPERAYVDGILGVYELGNGDHEPSRGKHRPLPPAAIAIPDLADDVALA